MRLLMLVDGRVKGEEKEVYYQCGIIFVLCPFDSASPAGLAGVFSWAISWTEIQDEVDSVEVVELEVVELEVVGIEGAGLESSRNRE